MKRFAAIFCAFLASLALIGCGGNTPISGKWVEESTGYLYDFGGNDELTIDTGNEVQLGAQYVVDEENSKVTITVNAPGVDPVSSVGTYELGEDTLTITGEDGKTTVLKKN